MRRNVGEMKHATEWWVEFGVGATLAQYSSPVAQGVLLLVLAAVWISTVGVGGLLDTGSNAKCWRLLLGCWGWGGCAGVVLGDWLSVVGVLWGGGGSAWKGLLVLGLER